MSTDDPARKYIPKSKDQTGTRPGVMDDHGTFTKIAYFTAWMVASAGSVLGAFLVLSGLAETRFGPDFITAGIGLGIIVSSWVGASGIGTLAEISRKLTKH